MTPPPFSLFAGHMYMNVNYKPTTCTLNNKNNGSNDTKNNDSNKNNKKK